VEKPPPLCPPTLRLKGFASCMNKSLLQVFEEPVAVFKVGDEVEAVFDEDQVFYMATVLKVHVDGGNRNDIVDFRQRNSDECCKGYDVRFVDYGNIQHNTKEVRALTPFLILEQLGFSLGDSSDQQAATVLTDLQVPSFCHGLELRDVVVGGKVLECLFSGACCVKALIDLGVASTRSEGVRAGRDLMKQNLFKTVFSNEFSDSIVVFCQLNLAHPR
jgi:hypothetical protein